METFRQFMAKQPKENMKLQLKELATNEMLKSMFPSLSILATINLSIPVATASVELFSNEVDKKLVYSAAQVTPAFHTL